MSDIHTRLRFLLHRLPFFPAKYYLKAPDGKDIISFWWSCVLPSIAPGSHALDFKFHGWDVAEVMLLARLKDEIQCFWDIGAHHGLYSIALGILSNGRAEIHAFEPSDACRRRITIHQRMNGVRGIQFHPEAVGNLDGEVTFAVPRKSHGTIGYVLNNEEASSEFREVSVPSITLDSWFRSGPGKIPDLIKIDVEGHETALLDGAGTILGNGKTAWIFEVLDHDRDKDTVHASELIERFVAIPGMKIFHIGENGYLSPVELQSHYPHTHLCNYLAVPVEDDMWGPRLQRLRANQP